MSIDVQVSVILFTLFVLLLAIVLNRVRVLRRDKREMSWVHYGRVAIFCFFVFGSIIGILGHTFIMLGTIFIGGLFCSVLIPFSIESDKNELAEDFRLKKVDASEPMRFRDFSSWNFIPKLERKYGEFRAMAIYLIIGTSIAIVMFSMISFLMDKMLYANDPWYRGGDYWYRIPGPAIGFFVVSFIGYRNVKRALKQSKNSSTLPQGYSPSANGFEVNIFCINCEAAVPPDARFCTNCGKQISQK